MARQGTRRAARPSWVAGLTRIMAPPFKVHRVDTSAALPTRLLAVRRPVSTRAPRPLRTPMMTPTADPYRIAPTDDFASAVMVRALALGMRELGLASPAVVQGLAPRRGRVALGDKRALVGAAFAQGGFAALPLLGRGVNALRNEPTHRCLTATTDPAQLFARWMRLERYIHSRHRIRVLRLLPGGAELEHRSLAEGAAPLAAEDLVVLGVLCALLEAIGTASVRARVGEGADAYPRPDAAALARAAADGSTARWTIDWSARRDAPAATAQAAAPDWLDPAPDGLAGRVAAVLARDLSQPPSLAGIAEELGMSPRSLQRELSRAGTHCRAMLAELRGRAAAWWLLERDAPIAEIGFLCGYADQPHFTRQFRDRVGMTPARYREAFMRRA